MTFIDTTTDPASSEAVDAMYAADRERFGYLPNFTRAFTARPAAYAAWLQLNGAIKAEMDPRRYELATLAASRRLRSTYCTLAHGSVLRNLMADEPNADAAVRSLVADHRAADLEPVEVAVMDLAEKAAADATSITQGDVDGLRALGLTDPEILDVVLAAAARCFFSTTLDALGVEPDARYAELEPELRDALTVGRPIAGG